MFNKHYKNVKCVQGNFLSCDVYKNAQQAFQKVMNKYLKNGNQAFEKCQMCLEKC